MNSVSEAEAIALLVGPNTCVEIGDWEQLKQQPGTCVCRAGVLDQEGVAIGLIVELLHRRTQKTRSIKYKFTVFKQEAWGLERVYQLDIEQFHKQPKNTHDLPHEHLGDNRIRGEATWSSWTFSEALQYFTKRTKIVFQPPVKHPEVYELRG